MNIYIYIYIETFLRPKDLIIYNWYYITGNCKFSDCTIQVGNYYNLGATSGDEECASLVREKRPDALGVTRYKSGGNNCYAEYGTKIISSFNARCCIFPGNNSSYLLTFVF